MGSTFFIFICYQSGYHIGKVCSSLRGLLFLFAPANFFYPGVIQLSFCLYHYINDENITNYIKFSLAFSLFFLVAIMAFSMWAGPLLHETPMLNSSHIPSRLVPDNFYERTLYIYAIMIGIFIVLNNSISIYFFLVFSFFYGIFIFVNVWKHPMVSLLDSAIMLAICVSQSLNPIILVIPELASFELSESIRIAITFIILIISLIVCYLLMAKKNSTIINKFITGDLNNLSEVDAITYAQVAISKSAVTEELLEFLNVYYERYISSTILFMYLYTSILIAGPAEKDDLKCPMSGIIQVKNIPWVQRFIAFELYRSFSQPLTLPFPIQHIDKLEAQIQKYNNRNEEFWTLMLAGKINDAEMLIHKMMHQYHIMTRDFMQCRSFYKRHPKIIEFQSSFFQKFDKSLQEESMYSNLLNFTSDLQRRYNSFVKRQINNNEYQHDDAASTVTENNEDRQMMTISNNIHRLIKRPIPFFGFFIMLITFVCYIGYSTILLYPSVNLMNDMNKHYVIPKFLNYSFRVSLAWFSTNYGLENINKRTPFQTENCSQSLQYLNSDGEPQGIDCVPPSRLINGIITSSKEIHEDLYQESYLFNSMKQNSMLDVIRLAMYNPVIPLYPIKNGNKQDDLKIQDTIIDIRSAMMDITTRLILYSYIDSSINSTDSQIYQYTNQDPDNLFNITSEIQHEVAQIIGDLRNYIEMTRKDQRTGISSIEIAFIVILAIIVLTTVYSFRVYKYKYVYKQLNKYFRPQIHPTLDPSPKFSTEVEPFHISYFSFNAWVVFFFFIIIIYLGIHLGMWSISINDFQQMMNECEAFIGIQNITQLVSYGLISYFKIYQFNGDVAMIQYLDSLKQELIDAEKEFVNVISPYKINRLWNKSPPQSLQFICKKPLEDNSIHDIYACWPSEQQISFYNFILLNLPNLTNYEQIINSSSYRNAQHLFITHLLDDMSHLSQNFSNYALSSSSNAILCGYVDIGSFSLCLFVVIMLTIFVLISFHEYMRQIARIYQVLLPRTIAQDQCLMDYVIKNKEKKTTKSKIGSYFSIYENTGIALVIISDRFTILAFTHAIQTMFSYRAEQLIGQHISVLIPKGTKDDNVNTVFSFYQQLQLIKKRSAEPVFNRELMGRASNGDNVPLHVRVSLCEYEQQDYFIIECKSTFELSYYDDFIQRHKEVFDEMERKTMPVYLFPEFSEELPYTMQHFQNYFLVYMMIPKMDVSDQLDKDDFIGQIRDTIPYFEGGTEPELLYSCVLELSCCHATILFVDNEPDSSHLFEIVWQFLTNYVQADANMKTGCILAGNDIDVILFAPPQVPEEFNTSKMPTEVAQSLIPSMTLEPLSPIMQDLSCLIPLLKPYTIIVSKSLQTYLNGIQLNPFPNDLNYQLLSFDLSLC